MPTPVPITTTEDFPFLRPQWQQLTFSEFGDPIIKLLDGIDYETPIERIRDQVVLSIPRSDMTDLDEFAIRSVKKQAENLKGYIGDLIEAAKKAAAKLSPTLDILYVAKDGCPIRTQLDDDIVEPVQHSGSFPNLPSISQKFTIGLSAPVQFTTDFEVIIGGDWKVTWAPYKVANVEEKGIVFPHGDDTGTEEVAGERVKTTWLYTLEYQARIKIGSVEVPPSQLRFVLAHTHVVCSEWCT